MSTEDFDSKRPDHPDFKTSQELKMARFSGIRRNSVSHYVELWVDGEVRKEVSEAKLASGDRDLILAGLWTEVFQLVDPVSIEGH